MFVLSKTVGVTVGGFVLLTTDEYLGKLGTRSTGC